MPSLNEYIETLRKYNPGITDRSITIYLLKDGWNIDEIEKTFKEINGGTQPVTAAPSAPTDKLSTADILAAAINGSSPSTPTPAPQTQATPSVSVMPQGPIADPVVVQKPEVTAQQFTPAPVIKPVEPIATVPSYQTVTPPPAPSVPIYAINQTPASAIPTSIVPPTPSPVVETPIYQAPAPIVPPPAPQVVHTNTSIEVQPSEIAGAIPHPSFAKIEQRPAQFPVAASTPNVVMPSSSMNVMAGQQAAPISDQGPVEAQVSTAIGIPKKDLEDAVEAMIHPVQSRPPVAAPVAAPQAAAPVTQSAPVRTPGFGEPVATLKPKFSYNEIMKDVEVNDTVYSPLSASAPATTPEPVVPTKSMAPSIETMNAPTRPSSLPQAVVSRELPKSETYGSVMQRQGAMAAEAARIANLEKEKAMAANAPLTQVPGVPVINSMQPAMGVMAPIVKKKSGLGKKIILWIILLACLGGLVFGYFKYVHGIYLFANAPYDKEHFLKDFVKGVASVKTAEYKTQITIGASPVASGTEIFDTVKLARLNREANTASSGTIGDNALITESSAGTIDGLLRMIPADAEITGGVSGVYDSTGNGQNTKFAINGAYNGDGINIAVDAESAKVGDVVYARLNKFPSFFIDLSAIKDKWILMTKDDLEDTAFSSWFGGEDSGAPVTKDDAVSAKKQLQIILEIADANNLVQVIGEPVKKTLEDERVVYEYETKVALPNLIATLEQASTQLKAEYGEKALINLKDEDLKSLRGEAFAYYFNYLNNNTSVFIGIDSKGKPAYIHTSSKIALQGSDLSKQINSKVDFDFSKINESVSVKAPTEDVIEYIDAYSKVTGKSETDIVFDRQIKRVESIREAIKTYISYTGESPVLLQDLNKSSGELLAASTTFAAFKQSPAYTQDSYARYRFATSSAPIYRGSFKDVYSSGNMVYQKNGPTAYNLTYTINLPGVPKDGYNLLFGIAGYDYTSSGSSQSISNPMMVLEYAEGSNTATERVLSKEADLLTKIDSDKDRVSDALEKFLGTNPAKTDTDGDGVNDYVEIRSSSNPKGPGAWSGQFEVIR